MAERLTHLDESGAARMVDVGEKPSTHRMARASARLTMAASTLELIQDGGGPKGDVLQVARLAGVMAAKRTDELIPLCHSLPLESVSVDFEFEAATTLRIESTARVTGKTGVEMEALTAVTTAALTVYDMCKAVDRGIVIGPVQLEEKAGGRSGTWQRSDNGDDPSSDSD
ncbi:Cyclic pyranopterin monophosphate synthase accessory protein [Posidoniimonas polymericola]|uniref:Cyclic pyranopterin monophosphate synthase n=1 Tax=Posidoniimonas polymericola TaxID=2528002 RepID=A0A5C5YU90_9BACT|nr:cyclic pyranopterin monophosphate synthase MoaC [Posidoniimonas polymericola]TWT78548.1 Cyclic pyranopterin monophosphate synthase accessory protein [Posidoniimonas polymericola]